ncbi:hypothetical protein J6S88_01850 [bacterium]|nr:hypothetical protein [bacterium]
MAYDTFVKGVNGIDINNPTSSIEGNSLLKELSSAPNVPHGNKGVNQDPSLNGNPASEIGGATNVSATPKAYKADYKDPTTMVNAMVMESMNNRYNAYIDFSNSTNPLLR